MSPSETEINLHTHVCEPTRCVTDGLTSRQSFFRSRSARQSPALSVCIHSSSMMDSSRAKKQRKIYPRRYLSLPAIAVPLSSVAGRSPSNAMRWNCSRLDCWVAHSPAVRVRFLGSLTLSYCRGLLLCGTDAQQRCSSSVVQLAAAKAAGGDLGGRRGEAGGTAKSDFFFFLFLFLAGGVVFNF